MPRSVAGKTAREQKLSAATAWKRGHTGGRGKGKFRGGGRGGRGGDGDRGWHQGGGGGRGVGALDTGAGASGAAGYDSSDDDRPVVAVNPGDAYQALLASLVGSGDGDGDDEFADALAAGQEGSDDESSEDEEGEGDEQDETEDDSEDDEVNAKNSKSIKTKKKGAARDDADADGSDDDNAGNLDDENLEDNEPASDDEAGALSGDEEDLVGSGDDEDGDGDGDITTETKKTPETGDDAAQHGLALHLSRPVDSVKIAQLKQTPFKFKPVSKFEQVRSAVGGVSSGGGTASDVKKSKEKHANEPGRWEFDSTARGEATIGLREFLPTAPCDLPTKLKERWNAVCDPVSHGKSQKKAKLDLKQATVAAKKRGEGLRAAVESEKAKIAERSRTAAPAKFVNNRQREFYGVLNTYADVTFTERQAPGSTGAAGAALSRKDKSSSARGDADQSKTTNVADPIMDAYLLHAIAHVMRTRRRITKNNETLLRRAKAEECARDLKKHAERVARAAAEVEKQALKDGTSHKVEGAATTETTPTATAIPYKRKNLLPGMKNRVMVQDDVPRDQGFARPTVLILVPMRNIAGRVVRRLLELCPAAHGRADSVSKMDRFADDFGHGDGSDDEEVEQSRRRKRKNLWVPDDHTALFKGNTDDHFRLGMKITKASVRLYVDFFGSDILIASPLGLATKLKEAGPAASDFLAAIELLVVDNADVIAMQNWSHLQTVLESLNQIPKKNTDVDVMRVRETHLEGFARHHRQTVFLSSFASAEINALSRVSCQNVAGRARYRVNSYPGVLGRAAAASGGARLRFDRVPDAGDETSDEKKNAVAEHDDARFKHFVKFALPRLRENPRAGSVVFVPSYFDFVKVRNLLTECEVSFAVASEYTPPRDAARARTIFADGRKRVLLVTERAHFYHRRKVKGVREVIFYGLPEHPEYFAEFVEFAAASGGDTHGGAGFVKNASDTTATASFSRLDGLRLERIVGTQRAKKMLAPDANSAFVFTA